MSGIPIGMAASEGVILTVLTNLKNGKIEDAIARFAEEIRFKDHGIGLEFKDKERLGEFFQKARELYPNSFLQTDTILVSGDHVITEWTLQATWPEPFYGQLHEKFESRCTGSPWSGRKTPGSRSGPTTTTD